jgi:hypothetical protein
MKIYKEIITNSKETRGNITKTEPMLLEFLMMVQLFRSSSSAAAAKVVQFRSYM